MFVDNVVASKPRPHFVGAILHVLPGPGGRTGLLLWLAIATVLLFVLATVVAMLTSLLSTTLSTRMTYRLGGDLFRHLQRRSPMFHYRRPVGDTIARVTGRPNRSRA